MQGYYIRPSGELTLLGETTLSDGLLKEAKKAFNGNRNRALKNQLEALFMSHFLESLPDSWNPKCGAIVHKNVWIGGPRVSGNWLKAFPSISGIGLSQNGTGSFSFPGFPDFWFCCTKEDTPEGFNNVLTTKTFFSDMVGYEDNLLKSFKSIYWTRLCPLEHPPHMLHLAKTSVYSLKTVKAGMPE
jgi:hypothetical protein